MTMKPCCLITDSSAQFLLPFYEKIDYLKIIPFDMKIGDTLYPAGKGISSSLLPTIADDKTRPILIPLSQSKLSEYFQQIASEYDQVIGIFLSSSLNQTFNNAADAARESPARNRIHIIDSLTVANGLGLLVQKAVQMVENGYDTRYIVSQIRNLIPRIYTVITTLSASYLYYSGFLDLPQVISLDLLGYYPIFTLEEGQLKPVQKVKTISGLANYFLEFLGEFSDLESVSLVHNEINFSNETKLLKETCKESHPDISFVELIANPQNVAMFGLKNLIFSIVEK